MSIQARKVGIVGVGHVGSHSAYSLAIQGIVDELVLCDTNDALLASQTKDLFDAARFFPHRVKVSSGEIEDLADCDIVVNCTAREIPKVALRDAELVNSVHELRDFMPKLMKAGFKGIFINITNPCDAITQLAQEISGLDPKKCFGTGTYLDSSRLCSILGRETNLEPNAVHAYMLGEHGNAQFAAWSNMSVGGKSLAELEKTDPRFANLDHEKIEEETRKSGYTVWFGKFGIDFSVTSVLADVVRCIYHDQKTVLPLSVKLTGQYGESGVYISTPVIIGRGGIEDIIELRLPENELANIKASCASVRSNLEKAKGIK